MNQMLEIETQLFFLLHPAILYGQTISTVYSSRYNNSSLLALIHFSFNGTFIQVKIGQNHYNHSYDEQATFLSLHQQCLCKAHETPAMVLNIYCNHWSSLNTCVLSISFYDVGLFKHHELSLHLQNLFS